MGGHEHEGKDSDHDEATLIQLRGPTLATYARQALAASEDKGSVVSAEAEQVDDSYISIFRSLLVLNDVKSDFWIDLIRVRCRGNDASRECEHGRHRAQGSGCAEHVSSHGLGGFHCSVNTRSSDRFGTRGARAHRCSRPGFRTDVDEKPCCGAIRHQHVDRVRGDSTGSNIRQDMLLLNDGCDSAHAGPYGNTQSFRFDRGLPCLPPSFPSRNDRELFDATQPPPFADREGLLEPAVNHTRTAPAARSSASWAAGD